MIRDSVCLRKGVVARLLATGVCAILFFAAGAVRAESGPPLRVVASFSILGDMVDEIGGEHVDVALIVGPHADAHAYEPTPGAVQALGGAQLLVENGLAYETWLPRLIQSSGFNGPRIVASKGVRVRHVSADPGKHPAPAAANLHRHSHGQIDPHAWLDLSNGMIYAQNIADGLALADPEHAAYYARRAKKYIEKMEALDEEIKLALGAIPASERKAITGHDAFGYFGDAYGVEFTAAAGLSSDAEPSARDIAALVDRTRQEKRVGIFTESASNPKLMEQLGREAGLSVGGPLYSDALAGPDEPAGTYLGMFHWNAGQLISVLK